MQGRGIHFVLLKTEDEHSPTNVFHFPLLAKRTIFLMLGTYHTFSIINSCFHSVFLNCHCLY